MLDFEQKRARTESLEVHMAEYREDPRFVPKPLKFLESEWQRPLRPLRPPQSRSTQRPKNARERLLGDDEGAEDAA